MGLEQETENIKELVKKANNKNSWGERLKAIEKLRYIDCQERKDVIIRLSKHDKVYKVMEEAFRIAQQLKFKENGKPIYLGKKDIGFKAKNFTKTFARIKTECKMEELDLTVLKNKFLIVNPEMYDVMQYEKANRFDNWIESIYKTLPKK